MRSLVVATSLWLLAWPQGSILASQGTQPQPSPPAVVNGRALDPSGAAVAGARITVLASDGRAAATTVTDANGTFSIALPEGEYRLVVRAEGFVESSGTLRTADRASTREIVLQVAGIRETVSVSAAGPTHAAVIGSATRTLTPLADVPQSITVVTEQLMNEQLMASVADVVRFVPGITAHQGENNRDDVIIRGNRSSADFFLNGVRDDVQYFRDLYNVERVEALKGPNAMIFGRGGGGGVINRVVKEAIFAPARAISLRAGAYGHKRVTADLGHTLSTRVAARVNGMFEDSGSFRDTVEVERAAINPTVTYAPGAQTRMMLGYEYLRDTRVADRGIPSFQDEPVDVDRSTYYGDPAESHVRARVNLASALIEHRAGAMLLRNRTMAGWYDRFYQNFVPGSVTPDGARVALTAYNNRTDRINLFNQTDVTYQAATGALRHTLLAGVEAGLQRSDNFRNTGFFDDATTSVLVSVQNPVVATPVIFRQNATDADNHVRAALAAVFAQDQVELSKHVLLLGGIRFDRFDMQYRDNRSGERLSRVDDLVSPRAGIVVKPIALLSLYGSYSVSYLPSSGDQFSSLTVVTEQLEPERFDNYEIGVKWDVRDALSVSSSVYRLDRTNTRSTDPNDPSRILQTGSQRTYGYELGLNGRITSAWWIAGGYAWQDASVTSATTAAPAGARVPQVPRHALSLWNHYRFHPRVAAGLGVVHQTDVFAAIDNTVVLPRYTRVDAGAFVDLTDDLRLQANVENLFDREYFVNANSNANISPGGPRAIRVAVSTKF